MTIRSDIRDAVIAALNNGTPSNVPAATKRRWIPGERLSEPIMAVFYVSEDTTLQSRTAGVSQRALRLSIQIVYLSDDIDGVDDLVEEAAAWVIEALADSNLNGLASWVQEVGTAWEAVKMERVYMVAQVQIDVNYQTKRSDLYAQA